MKPQAHNSMLPNNGTVSEQGAIREACVTTQCSHLTESAYLDSTERAARRLLDTDHCSRITRHLSTRNLTFQNGVTYTWDSENRLLSITDGTTTNTFTYDGNHRRVTKRTTVSGTVTQKTHFLYDGWNVIEERTNYDTTTTFTLSTFALTRTLTWGTDLSGSLQGAGGVGGLIMSEEISGTTTTAYHYHYDGNGNVTEVTDSSGNSAATYRYDAFGNTLVSTGTYATTNKYRFSTKPIDSEISTAPLYYYGYRYYDPNLGRWMARDPIGERGGLNLYGFVGNNSVAHIDILGEKILWDLDHCYDPGWETNARTKHFRRVATVSAYLEYPDHTCKGEAKLLVTVKGEPGTLTEAGYLKHGGIEGDHEYTNIFGNVQIDSLPINFGPVQFSNPSPIPGILQTEIENVAYAQIKIPLACGNSNSSYFSEGECCNIDLKGKVILGMKGTGQAGYRGQWVHAVVDYKIILKKSKISTQSGVCKYDIDGSQLKVGVYGPANIGYAR